MSSQYQDLFTRIRVAAMQNHVKTKDCLSKPKTRVLSMDREKQHWRQLDQTMR